MCTGIREYYTKGEIFSLSIHAYKTFIPHFISLKCTISLPVAHRGEVISVGIIPFMNFKRHSSVVLDFLSISWKIVFNFRGQGGELMRPAGSVL